MHKNIILSLIFVFVSLIAPMILAKDNLTSVYTTHPQVAHTLNFIVSDIVPPPFIAKPIFKSMSNVHDFGPTIKDLKSLKNKGPLLAGPLTHQKWVLNAKELNLLPSQHYLLRFKNSTNEHFWLDVKMGCEFEKVVLNILDNWQIKVSKKKDYCLWLQERSKQTQSIFYNKGIKKIIITHSALYEYFKNMGLQVLVLRNYDHQKEITPQKLKEAYRWKQDKSSVLVIHEKGFSLPPQLQNVGFQKIKWSPLEDKPRPLMHLQREIEKLKGNL